MAALPFTKRTRKRSRASRDVAHAAPLRAPVGDLLLLGATVLTVLVAWLFGGAPTRPGFGLFAFSAVGLATLVVALLRGTFRAPIGLPARVLLVLACALPFVQILPLPYALWTSLPGHDLAQGTFVAAGMAGRSFTWSVTPFETLVGCLFVFPLAGVFLAVLGLSDDDVDWILLVVGGMILIGLLVGIVQVATAGEVLRFHAKADFRYLLAFFSNKNHSATLLAAAILLLAYFLRRSRLPEVQRWFVLAAGAVLLLAAILATNSRAGLALGGLATALAAGGLAAGRVRLRWLVGGGVIAAGALSAALLSFSTVAGRSVERYGDVGVDRRWTIWTDTMVAVRAYFPLGSGLGSFVPVYRSVEPLGSVNPRFANRAHNDYLELALEGGVPALALIALFVGIWAVRSYRLLAAARADRLAASAMPRGRRYAPPPPNRRREQALVGSGVILLILLHSFGDYPLRTATWATLFVMAFALLLRDRAGDDR